MFVLKFRRLGYHHPHFVNPLSLSLNNDLFSICRRRLYHVMCEQGTITQSLKVPLLPEPREHKTLQKTPRSQDLLKAQQFPNNFCLLC